MKQFISENVLTKNEVNFSQIISLLVIPNKFPFLLQITGT